MAGDDLEARLRSHSDFFTSMVKLIPERCYLVTEEDEDEDEQSSKFFRNKRNMVPKSVIKEASKRTKRLKFNPLEDKESEEKMVLSESVSEDMKKDNPHFSVEHVQSSSLPELRERLRNRLTELRTKRNAQVETNREKQLKKHKERKDKSLAAKGISASHATSKEPDRPSIEDNGQLVFSKFDFSTPLAERKPTGKKKDYKKLLAKAEAKQKKIEEMTEQDLKKGRELQEHLKWQQANSRAEGKKMKDDLSLLHKTLKQIDKRRTKSRKDWDQRLSIQEKAVAKRQEIRQQHIQERIDLKKAKSVGKRRGGKGRKAGF